MSGKPPQQPVPVADRPYADPLFGLTFQFQPIVAADGRSVMAYELLARRTLQDGTIQGPAAFLETVTAPDRIEAFTRHSLDFALSRLRMNPNIPALSVNLSPRQIELGVTEEMTSRASPAVRRRLMVELTEDSIAGHPALPGNLAAVASLGVRVLLDDVALAWRQRCADLRGSIHGLKLDRSLLSDFSAQRLGEASGELLDFAAECGLVLVAEGIEDADLLPRLASRGVAYFQGFALGEPWSEPRVARRRISPPRSAFLLAGQGSSGVESSAGADGSRV